MTTSAQTRDVTGSVTSASDNGALPGVTVRIQGSNQGVVTDARGHYVLHDVPGNAVLEVSSIGFITQTIQVKNQKTIDVQLRENATNLNALVVVGYGTQKRKDLTGSISTVAAADIERSNPISPFQALQGQAAGINIAKTSGLPGTDYNIDIRGLGSINYDNTPLVVIDGNMDGDLNTLNPSDIASIDVLKDASATAIYGSRGANGVIIVTTKDGQKGTIKVNYSGYVGERLPSHLPTMQNAKQWAAANPNPRNGYSSTEEAMLAAGKSTDWVALVTNPGLQTSHVISISGGFKGTSYYFSGGYLNQDGLVDGINYKRYSLSGKINSQINKYLKVGFNTNFSYGIQNTGSLETLRSAYRARPTGTVYYKDLLDPSESNDVDFHGYSVWMGIKDNQVLNPLVEGYPGNDLTEHKLSRLSALGYVEIAPVKGLTIKTSLGTNFYGTQDGDYRGTFTKSNKGSLLPTASHDTKSQISYTLDNLLTYDLTKGQHHFNLTALQSAFKRRDEKYSISVKDLPYESEWYNLGTAGTITGVSSNLVQRTLLSYMGRLNYSFEDKYLLTLTGRWDGASQLAVGHQWGFFPSAAFAWRMISEPFFKNARSLSDLKLRVSYGLVGNNVVPPYGTQASLENTNYNFDGVTAYGFAPAAISNHLLGWEKSKEFDLGLNIGFLDNRITADIDVYQRNTMDLIMKQQLPPSTGFTTIISNVGKVRNQGLEISVNTINIKTHDFSWRTSINFSHNQNKITALADGLKEDIGNTLFVGQPLDANYDYQFVGIWQTKDSTEAKSFGQKLGTVRVADLNHDGKINADDDRKVLGSTQPKWTMGIVNKFHYKQWDLSFMIYTKQGVQYKNAMLSGTMGQIGHSRYNALVLNTWTPTNPTNDWYQLNNPGPYESAIFYQDASYWRISDITLGYQLPAPVLSRLKISNLRVYAQISNPFVFTNFLSFDPEYNSSTYIDDIPSLTCLVGVNISF
jgi:TonB-linked SusC/RagA family outer membrane protein